MGNANVVYSAWKAVDVSTNFSTHPDTDPNTAVYLGNDTKTDNAILTQDAIDPATGETKLVERILTTNEFVYVKIPGRTTNKDEDFVNYYVGNDLFATNYLKFSMFVYKYRFGVLIPDLANKSAQFFRDMVKDMPQYRIIVAYGSTPGGRAAAVDFKDYATVKKAYNLLD